MTIKLFITSIIISILCAFSAGYYIGNNQPSEIIVKKVVQNKIKKDLNKFKLPELKKELNCYYKSDFITTWNKKNSREWQLNVSLCDRNMSQNFTVPIAESNNWKFNVGLGLGVVGTVATIYIMRKVLR